MQVNEVGGQLVDFFMRLKLKLVGLTAGNTKKLYPHTHWVKSLTVTEKAFLWS